MAGKGNRHLTHRKAAGRILACLFALACFAPASNADATEIIQLAPFMVHAQPEGTGIVRFQPISVRLVVRDKKRADYVCALYPRLRDAVVRYLSTQRFVLTKKGHLSIDGIEQQLRRIMTGALRWDILEKIDVIRGSHELPSVVAARLMQDGCLRIEDHTIVKH